MKYETSWSFPYNEVLEERIFNKQQYKWKTFTYSAHIVLFRVTIILQDLNYYIVTYKYNWKVIFLIICVLSRNFHPSERDIEHST
jgi:hypothetical protein